MTADEPARPTGALRADRLLEATATAHALATQLQRLDLRHSAPIVRRSIETALATAQYQLACLRLARDAVAASGGYVLSDVPDDLDLWLEKMLSVRTPLSTERAEQLWTAYAHGSRARNVDATRLQEEIDRSERRARRLGAREDQRD